jgi:hypothetical protein
VKWSWTRTLLRPSGSFPSVFFFKFIANLHAYLADRQRCRLNEIDFGDAT